MNTPTWDRVRGRYLFPAWYGEVFVIRRLITSAAGVAVLGTVAVLPLAAPAGASVHHSAASHCTKTFRLDWVRSGTHTYYLGGPNRIFAGSPVILKTANNDTSLIGHCRAGSQVVLFNRGLAMTTRETTVGMNVIFATVRNHGNGYASQRWIVAGTNPFRFWNVKTHLALRVRNSGPMAFQTVTTGHTATNWHETIP